jgi:hypothetical protein
MLNIEWPELQKEDHAYLARGSPWRCGCQLRGNVAYNTLQMTELISPTGFHQCVYTAHHLRH